MRTAPCIWQRRPTEAAPSGIRRLREVSQTVGKSTANRPDALPGRQGAGVRLQTFSIL
jgi:hypothetical protein